MNATVSVFDDEVTCRVDGRSFLAEGPHHSPARLLATITSIGEREVVRFGEREDLAGYLGAAIEIESSWSTRSIEGPIVFADAQFFEVDGDVAVSQIQTDHLDGVRAADDLLLIVERVFDDAGSAVHVVRNAAWRTGTDVSFGRCTEEYAAFFGEMAERRTGGDAFDAAVAWARDPDAPLLVAVQQEWEAAERAREWEVLFARSDPRIRFVRPQDVPPTLQGQWVMHPMWARVDDVEDDERLVVRTGTGMSATLGSIEVRGIDAFPVYLYPGDTVIEIVRDTNPESGGDVVATIAVADLTASTAIEGSIDAPVLRPLDEQQTVAELGGLVSTIDEFRSLLGR